MPDTTVYFFTEQEGWKSVTLPAGMPRTLAIIDSLHKNDSIIFRKQFVPNEQKDDQEGISIIHFLGVFLIILIAFNASKLFRSIRSVGGGFTSHLNENTHLINQFAESNPGPQHILNGNRQKYSREELHEKLTKHFPYYSLLTNAEKERFISRTLQFIAQKTFIIYANVIYHEMLILTSATAVQLTFGLKNYLLPSYTTIKIFPEEFVGLNPLRVLAGNVSGSVITIAWNHLLEGAKNPSDGKNLGLHEMSHALSMEMMVHQKRKFKSWESSMDAVRDHFPYFIGIKKETTELYNENAKRNEEEFFAESIELFFEKPDALAKQFPTVYQILCSILNQNPKECRCLIPLQK
jgi:MtfA peptidase